MVNYKHEPENNRVAAYIDDGTEVGKITYIPVVMFGMPTTLLYILITVVVQSPGNCSSFWSKKLAKRGRVFTLPVSTLTK